MFLLDRLFREKAVQRMGRPDPLDRLLRVTAPHEWMLLAGSGLVLLGFAAWGLFGAMEIDVRSGACVLVRPGERHAVVSSHAGVVVEVLAEVGDRVEEGQALARVTAPELRRETRIARARAARLEDLAGQGPGDPELRAALAAARTEALDRAAAEAAGELVVSPRAGEVMALELTPGRPVAALEPVGLVRDGADDQLEALAFLPAAGAQRVRAGMAAQILVAAAGGRRAEALPAEIRDVSPRPVPRPHWIEGIGGPASGRAHRVRVALAPAGGAEAGAGIPDGAGCETRVVLGRQAPVRLLLPRADG